MSFEQFGFSKSILKSITESGYVEPSEIQKIAMPYLISNNTDFVGQAQTGTGKTAAFVLPSLQNLNYSGKSIQVVILTPTRELAHQVNNELEKLGKYTPLRAATVYGGVSYQQQISSVKRGNPHVIVATPGRLLDLMRKDIVRLDQCKKLIIDEADEMLSLGFLEDVQEIIQQLNEERRLWMFSATMPKQVKRLVNQEFASPKTITTEQHNKVKGDVKQFYKVLRRKYFADALSRVISSEDCYAMVFCETRQQTKDVADHLIERGFPAIALHGEMNQSSREDAMAKFRKRQVKLLVCTDIAARGIDVADLTHVFNLGLPRQVESYVHRVGRTGRAGAQGTAISFIEPAASNRLRRFQEVVEGQIEPLQMPDADKLKSRKLANELLKLQTIKSALIQTGTEFKVDPTYKTYKEFFDSLTKDQILKLLFTDKFNADFRRIDEQEQVFEESFERKPRAAAKSRSLRKKPFGKKDGKVRTGRKNQRRRR